MENEQAEIERCISFLKAHGYSVTKRKAYVPISRCVCGAKRTHEVWGSGTSRACSNCGLTGKQATNSRDARIEFNKAVEEARKKIENDNR